jgi:hypothetical protein
MVVGLFALLGFVCVPLGHKTGFEHVKAIVQTSAAREAASDLARALIWARARVLGVFGGEGPEQESASPPPPPPQKGGPKPKVPRLGSD